MSALSALVGGAAGESLRRPGDRGARSAAVRYVSDLLAAIPPRCCARACSTRPSASWRRRGGERGARRSRRHALGRADGGRPAPAAGREPAVLFRESSGLIDDLVLRRRAGHGEPAAPAPTRRGGRRGLRTLFGAEDVDRVSGAQQRIDRIALELRRTPTHGRSIPTNSAAASIRSARRGARCRSPRRCSSCCTGRSSTRPRSPPSSGGSSRSCRDCWWRAGS